MDPSILVAVITGVVSLLVVLTTSIVAIITTKRANQASRELEELRYEMRSRAVRKEGFQTSTREAIKERINVLRVVCSALQSLRDDIRIIQATEGEDLDAFARVSKNSRLLIETYAESHYLFGALERSILHDIKNHVIMPSMYFNQATQQTIQYKSIKEQLAFLLEVLTIAQQVLIKEHEKLSTVLVTLPDVVLETTLGEPPIQLYVLPRSPDELSEALNVR